MLDQATPYVPMKDGKASRTNSTSTKTLWLFGFGAVPPSIKGDLLNNYLFYYYNMVLGLGASWVAAASALALIVDGVVDPYIGWRSDRCVSPLGRRHPFIFASLLPSVISYYALLSLKVGTTQFSLFCQLFILLCFLRISWALFEVPRGALAPEVTKDYDERTELNGISMAMGWLGGGAMSYATKQLFLRASYDDAEGYERLARWGSLALAVFGSTFALSTPYSPSMDKRLPPSKLALMRGSDDDDDEDGDANEARHVTPTPLGSSTLGARGHLSEALTTLSHRDFVAILASGLVYNLYMGVTMGLGAYINKFLWEWEPQDTAPFELVVGALALLVSLSARRLASRWEKRDLTLRLFTFAIVIGPLHLILRLADRWLGLPVFPHNGSKYGPLWWCLLAHAVLTTVPSILGMILLTSMIADVVEDSQAHTGRRSEGLFFAGPALLQKTTSGIGFLVKGWLLHVTGFEAAATSSEKAAAMEKVAFCMVMLALVLPTTAVMILARYQISRSSHQRNLIHLGYAAADR